MNDKLKVEELAILVGVSVQTINIWYRWKKANQDHEFAHLLPDFEQDGPRQTRFWNKSDVYSLLEFKSKLPVGRNGILGAVTQKYYHKNKEEK